MIVRSSKHHFSDLTTFKKESYDLLLKYYRLESQICLDYLWTNPIIWKYGTFDLQNDLLNCPSMLSTVGIQPSDSMLTARIWKCLITQCLGVIKSAIKYKQNLKQRRDWHLSQNHDVSELDKQINNIRFSKPDVSQINPELNSICCDFFERGQLEEKVEKERLMAESKGKSFDKISQSHFDGFLRIKCIGEFFGSKDDHSIRLPIKYHRKCNQRRKNGFKIMTSFLLCDDHIEIRWSKNPGLKKTKGTVVGADQGRKHVITLSDGQQITKNCHDHCLNDIVQAMERAKPGSKGFQKLKAHQINFIGAAINKLNLSDIQEIHLEDVRQMGKISFHWFYPLIKQRLSMRAEEESVTLKLQSSSYRSQRCSSCGFVLCRNRKGEEFECKACSFACQADLNAAKNHVNQLARCSRKQVERQGLSSKRGFYWLDQGIYSMEERREQLGLPRGKDNATVPAAKKEKIR